MKHLQAGLPTCALCDKRFTWWPGGRHFVLTSIETGALPSYMNLGGVILPPLSDGQSRSVQHAPLSHSFINHVLREEMWVSDTFLQPVPPAAPEAQVASTQISQTTASKSVFA